MFEIELHGLSLSVGCLGGLILAAVVAAMSAHGQRLQREKADRERGQRS